MPRPPEQRHALNGMRQIRPRFEAPAVSAPVTNYSKATKANSSFYCKQNTDSPMQRACHKPHDLVVLPLLSDLRYREAGPRSVPDLQGGPIIPYLAPRPKPHKQHMVSTYAS